VALRRPVQVVLFYSTAAVMPDDGPITFADDIYRHDARLDQALARVHDERMRQPPGWPKADGE
jgi:murein L,D-transpeptidase YcbB/YkuD